MLSHFDWEYYLSQNSDVGIDIKSPLAPQRAYLHWLNIGQKTDALYRFSSSYQLTNSIVINPPHNSLSISESSIDIDTPKFKFGVFIHIYNVTILNQIVKYISHIIEINKRFIYYLFINVVEGLYNFDDIKKYIHYKISKLKILPKSIKIIESYNQGGDIGGLIKLSQLAVQSKPLDYVYIFHSKSRYMWRDELCRPLVSFSHNKLSHPKYSTCGIFGSKKWVRHFFSDESFIDPLTTISRLYNIEIPYRWSFIGGTIFLAKWKIIETIGRTHPQKMISLLNTPTSIDENWLKIVKKMDLDPLDAGNDIAYRLLYNKPLHSDHMIEHAYERFIGVICLHHGLRVIGI